MKCSACTLEFDESTKSASCPHEFVAPMFPTGGFRMTKETQQAVEDAYSAHDQQRLYRLMGHTNPAVRIYAAQMAAALDQINKAQYEPAMSLAQAQFLERL